MKTFIDQYIIPYRGTLGRLAFLVGILVVILTASIIAGIVALISLLENSNPIPEAADGLLVKFQTKPITAIVGLPLFNYATIILPMFIWEKRLAEIIQDRLYTTIIAFVIFILPLALQFSLIVAGLQMSPFQQSLLESLDWLFITSLIALLFIKGRDSKPFLFLK